MTKTIDKRGCACGDTESGNASAFLAVRYHFGMLLGADDFDTAKAYHRDKLRLHNAWLHGEGVVWGFGVELEASGQLRVRPGLALDALGRELHLDADACLKVTEWFADRRKRFPDDDNWFRQEGPAIRFDAHIVICFKSCLTRQVPALAEPCEGSGTATEYSRIFETVEILLKPGLAPAPRARPYRRLRLFFGLDVPPPEDVATVESDQEVAAAPKTLASFRRFAAFDEIDLQPLDDDCVCLTLAELQGVQLATGENGLSYQGLDEVDVTVRPSHVATSTIQELLVGSLDVVGSPLVIPGSAKLNVAGNEFMFQTTAALDPASVTPAAFSVTFLTPAPGGWQTATIGEAVFDAVTNIVTLKLDTTRPLPQNDQVVRFVATASSPAPLLGDNAVPFNNSRDFVYMQKWS